MKYFEIKPDTREYSLANKIYTSSNAWSEKEVIEALTKVIGISPIKNMQCNAHVLKLWNLPDGVREQFKKNRDRDNYYEAYAKSELNQKYLGIVKRFGLINYGTTEFVFDIGLFGFLKTLCPIKTDDSLRYFVELKENLSDADIDKVKAKEYLTEIKEYEYLQLMVGMVKSQEDAQGRVSKSKPPQKRLYRCDGCGKTEITTSLIAGKPHCSKDKTFSFVKIVDA